MIPTKGRWFINQSTDPKAPGIALQSVTTSRTTVTDPVTYRGASNTLHRAYIGVMEKTPETTTLQLGKYWD